MPHSTRTRVPPDRESDVTWHHVIVHGCEGQKILRSQAQAGPMWNRWRGNYVYESYMSYLGVGIQENQCANSGSH